MKKLTLIIVLSLFSFCLFAQKEFIIQGMYMNSGRTFTNGTSEGEYKTTSLGLNFITFSELGANIGLFSSASFLLPQTFKVNSTDLMPFYDDWQIALDAMIGPGVNIPLGFPELLIGAGLHFNGYAFMPSNAYLDPDLSYTLGAGLSATAKFKFSEFFNLNISAMAGYDFMEIIHIPEWSSNVKFKSGLTTTAISAGLGFKY